MSRVLMASLRTFLLLSLALGLGQRAPAGAASPAENCFVDLLHEALDPNLEGFDPRLGVRTERIGDDLYLEVRDQSFVVDGGKSAASDYRLFKQSLAKEFEAKPRKFEMLQAESMPELTARVQRAEQILGGNVFDEAFKKRLSLALDRINALTEARNQKVTKLARQIKAENPKLHIQDAKLRALDQLDADPEFASLEVELIKRKLNYFDAYERRLSRIGVDLYADAKSYEAAARAADPFRDMPNLRRYVFRRGEAFEIRNFRKEHRDFKWELHKHEFRGLAENAAEYEKRILEHARSTDPKMISYQAFDPVTRKIHVFKYNPDTNELLVMGENGDGVASFYRPMPMSPTNPRGYRDARLTPLQYVIRNGEP